MSTRRWAALLMGALVAFGGFTLAAVPAQAAVCSSTGTSQYPPGQCSAGVSASSALPGQPVTAFGDGFRPGIRVNFRFSGGFFLGSAVADASGHVSLSFLIPSSAAAGMHTITLTGGGRTTTTSIRVLSTSSAAVVTSGNTTTGGLATTGANNLVPLVGGGAALVAVGAMTLFVVRRRRSDSVAI